MSFEKLIAKVSQAENALEARERQLGADLRQTREAWLSAWTPPRIIVAGVIGGFLTGRTSPLRAATSGGGLLRMVSLMSSLFATTSAAHAAEDAGQAAEDAEHVAEQAATAEDATLAAEQFAHEQLLREASAARGVYHGPAQP